ncbi:MAG: type II/IV secretion system protein [Candidatus Spechtbacteria bacterium SB0662_bin_43]|uniref:Type II/IV secretion system protein n=1 Tax=Candidatus Spechtbacteria bacterium SB0662_bin_43 TaxID=2604897 RepID=A0A845DAM5_9BACT|nr:type II/IV secretion system protein [Candidatus Spechtbacteria bacterium SB0662_bin_43]
MDSYTLTQEAIDQRVATIQSYHDIQTSFDALQEENASTVFEILMSAILIFAASDIHIDAVPEGARIRMRIDGILHDVAFMNEHLFSLVLSRVKMLSGLKINVRAAQDGRFSLQEPSQTIEIRVSLVPSEYGEDIALRVLDPRSLISIQELGMREDLYNTLLGQIKKPLGLILVTGPTGAGKTTTLYAILKFLQDPSIKIVTIEDPIEYHLRGASQTQVDEYHGYTFDEGIRGMLRQDPDIVMVSELRGIESLTAALQASLAGRLVLSTLHTNDSFGAIPRILDMGVKTDTVASGLNMVIAQRLVRKLCKGCKKEYQTTPQQAEVLNALLSHLPSPPAEESYTIYTASTEGCTMCGRTGYKGRIGVFELYAASRELSHYISKNMTELELMTMLTTEQGVTTMKQDAALRIVSGITSIPETERILGPLQSS